MLQKLWNSSILKFQCFHTVKTGCQHGRCLRVNENICNVQLRNVVAAQTGDGCQCSCQETCVQAQAERFQICIHDIFYFRLAVLFWRALPLNTKKNTSSCLLLNFTHDILQHHFMALKSFQAFLNESSLVTHPRIENIKLSIAIAYID
jgi:hypothetical protein